LNFIYNWFKLSRSNYKCHLSGVLINYTRIIYIRKLSIKSQHVLKVKEILKIIGCKNLQL